MEKDHRKILLISAFTAGVLLGWIVLGWWLLPVRDATALYDSQSDQARLVRLLAEDYWERGDLSRVRSSIEGWDKQELAGLLRDMEQDTSDPKEVQRLTRLRTDLVLPTPKLTVADLYERPEIAWSLNISLGLMVAAAVVRLWPADWQALLARFRGGQSNEEEPSSPLVRQEQMQANTASGNAASQGEPRAVRNKETLETLVQAEEEKDSPEEQLDAGVQENGEERQFSVKEVKAKESPSQVSMVKAKGQQDTPEKPGQAQRDSTDSGEGSTESKGVEDGQETEGTQSEDTEEPEGLEDLEDPEDLDDVLSSIFEEEDETLRELAALSEGLDEIDIRELSSEAKGIYEGLRELNRSH